MLVDMDIQPVVNEDKAVTYICQYFSKTEDRCSQTRKQATKEAFENNMHHLDTTGQLLKLTSAIEIALYRKQCTVFC